MEQGSNPCPWALTDTAAMGFSGTEQKKDSIKRIPNPAEFGAGFGGVLVFMGLVSPCQPFE